LNHRISILLLLSLFISGLAFAQPSGGPPPANVVVDQSRRDVIEPRREVTGELRAVRRSTLASQQSGLVASIDVEEGQHVEQGVELIRLDDTYATIEVAESESRLVAARAVVEAREAQLVRANRDLESIQSLGDSATEKEILDARSDVIISEAQLAQARADVLAAEAALQRAEQRVADMTITAPYGGVVIRKLTEVGQWIGVGDDVVEFVDLDVIDAWLDVPENLLARLELQGVDAQIRLRATGEVFSAPVSAIVPNADRLSRLFPVRVRLQNEIGRLRPGMSIVGLAPTGARQEMLTIHKDALLRDDAGAFVYFNGGGVAAVARVRVLFANGDRLVVESATLPADVGVVIEGNERLFPGQPLNIVGGGASEMTMSSRGG
jgi:RND family efflux transporter MFP subunit